MRYNRGMERLCVLAIECDWRIRKLIRANLEAVGLQVHEAVSGLHGLQLLRDLHPDLILVDLDMPDLDSPELLGVAQAHFPGRPVPVVALSADLPERWLLADGRVAGYLRKPFSAYGLMQQVWNVLEKDRKSE